MALLEIATLANNLEQHFTQLGEARFSVDEFDDVVIMFGALETSKERRKAYLNLKSLSKSEVVSRAKKAARLRSLLFTVRIRRHRDLSRSSTTQ